MHELLFVAAFAAFCTNPSFAAGKKQPNLGSTTPPTNSSPTTKDPVSSIAVSHPHRPVWVKPVSTRPFQLPNGSRIDLTADLDSMLRTSMDAINLGPTDRAATEGIEGCDSHLEFRSAVSTLELKVAEYGVSFGYTPSGETSTVSSITGAATVKVGVLAMEFQIYQCERSGCTQIAASTANHTLVDTGLEFKIDFGTISTGPSFAWHPIMSQIFKKVMDAGMQKLWSNPQFNHLPWMAIVKAVDSDGTLIFDAGSQKRIKNNESFNVYQSGGGIGICQVYRGIAEIHSIRVDEISSTAVIDKIYPDPNDTKRGIQPGDVVMIRVP